MDELYTKFRDVVESGDEEAARAFLKEHLNEFPEDLQQKIVFAFFQEAMADEAEIIKNTQLLKEKGLEILQELDRLKQIEDIKTTM